MRGTVTNLSPVDGTEAAKIPLLVKARGAEVGARTKFIEGLDSTITFWGLNFDSESQFNGDTGTTLFGRPSRRYGIELANHYSPYDWLHFDGDLTLSHARSRGFDTPQTRRNGRSSSSRRRSDISPSSATRPAITFPEAPPIVAQLVVEVGEKTGWFGAMKFRFKGVYPLTEDGYFKAPATGWLDVRGGYRWDNGLKLQLDIFNVLNSKSDQITYAYGSLLPTDPLFAPCQNGTAPAAVCAIGQMDRHFKPMEPLAARVTLSGPLSTHAFDPVFAPAPDARTPYKDFMAFAANVSSGNIFPPDDEGFMALASGLPNKKGPPASPPPVVWTGLHAGLNAGGIFGTSNLNVVGGPVAPGGDLGAATAVTGALTSGLGNFGDFLGGGQIGYDWQLGQERLGRARFVVGLEADIQAASGRRRRRDARQRRAGSLQRGERHHRQCVGLGASRLYRHGARPSRLSAQAEPAPLRDRRSRLRRSRTDHAASLPAVDGNGVPLGPAFGSTRYSNMLVGWTAGGGFEWMFHPNADIFKKGQVDAAVVWSPDDQDCITKVSGSKVLQSSREASYIIADVFIAKKAYVEKNRKKLEQLLEGWFKGAAEINTSDESKKKAAKILADGLGQPEDFCYNAINNARLCNYGDNVNFYNLNKVFSMPFGSDEVHSGSWLAGVQLGDAAWAAYKRGEITGFSIGGFSLKTRVPQASMPKVEVVRLVEEAKNART